MHCDNIQLPLWKSQQLYVVRTDFFTYLLKSLLLHIYDDYKAKFMKLLC